MISLLLSAALAAPRMTALYVLVCVTMGVMLYACWRGTKPRINPPIS